MKSTRPIVLTVALLVGIADQLSKWVILLYFMQPPRQIVVTPFFNLVLVYNTGISFGMFTGDGEAKRWILIVMALVIVLALLFVYAGSRSRLVAVGVGLVVGGALSNVIDRFNHPGVVDFLDFHFATWHWPAFNVADASIVVGAALLAYDGLFGSHATAK